MSLKFWKYCLIIGICLNFFLLSEEPEYVVVEEQAHVPILTPSLSQRQTLKLRLSNGLEVYLISDPEATQAGAVLTVQAGSWDDPDEHPGLAHFLEHMLFLGTEKYPIESDYDRYIQAHDGKSNAYTASDYTLYLFSISPPAFDEALDRFSSFFKKPLFNPSGVERELHAIDQEFAKNFDQDGTRESYVSKELANAQHPFHHFSIGSSKTLSKVTQDVLKQWYQNHYSAHLMKLIVYGPSSLETLKSLVVQDFRDISSTWERQASAQVPVLAEEMEGKIVYIEPVKNINILNLTWEVPAALSSQSSFKPESLIRSILGYEGPGSLLADLKTEDLADYVTSEEERLGKDHLIFSLSISLTEKGLKEIPRVVEHSFQAIQALQKQDLPAYLFDELKRIETIRYQYQSSEDAFNYLMDLGGLLVYEDLSTFPEHVMIPQTFDANLVREFLSYLTPQRAHFTILNRQAAVSFDRKEKWMEVPYKIFPLATEQLTALSDLPSNPLLHLPAPNPFIPQDLTLVNSFSPQQTPTHTFPKPQLLLDNPQGKIYFAADDRFQLPQTMWFFEIKTPSIEASDPTKVVLADLYIRSLEDKLHFYTYSAQLADLSYDISQTNNGILLTLSGYHDNAETLFDTIVENLKSCRPSEAVFEKLKDSLLAEHYDFSQESPLKQGREAYQNILYESYATYEQRVDALEVVSYETFLDYIDHLYDYTYIQGLLYGNVNQEQAFHVWNKLKITLDSQVFPREKQTSYHALALPAQSGPYAMDLNIQSPSHATILGLEAPTFSFKARAAQQILAHAISSAFFAELRTKQQTGYLIYSKDEEIDQHLLMFFAVQSTTHDPRDLLARFELFIESFLTDMERKELTNEQFESIRQSLLNTLEHSPQNLFETGQLLKTLAFKYEGNFDWMNKRIQGLKELTYEEFLKMTREFLGKQNKRRLALLVRGTDDNNFQYHSVSNAQDIKIRPR